MPQSRAACLDGEEHELVDEGRQLLLLHVLQHAHDLPHHKPELVRRQRDVLEHGRQVNDRTCVPAGHTATQPSQSTYILYTIYLYVY